MKKVYNILFMLMALVGFTACVPEVDDAFNKSASERINEAIATDLEILKAPANGWRMEYYGSMQYGGYNVFLKFEDDSVLVASEKVGATHKAGVDKDGNAITKKSHFKLEQSMGITMSFDDYNEIFHYFSDPRKSDYGTNGEAFGGDFEFRINSISAEKIILQGKKHGNRIVMYPMDENTSWGDYIKQVDETFKFMDSRSYTLTDEANETKIPALVTYRRMTFYTTDENGNATSIAAPFIVTPSGYVFYQKTAVKDYELNGFDKGDTEDFFYANGNQSLKLYTRVPTLYETLKSGSWFLTYEDMGEYGKAKWDVLLKKLGTVNNGKRARLNWVAIGYNPQSTSNFGFTMSVNGETPFQGLDFNQVVDENGVAQDDMVEIKWNSSKNNSAGKRYFNNDKWGMRSAMDPFYFLNGKSNGRKFKLQSDNERHPNYIILTDINTPTNVIKVWSTSQYFPFGDLDKIEEKE